ncbi:protein RALF-like 22 [Panicum virgatum]|uniref:Uncharacterized protein n=1 Tax=Panicum virgatum TaxID=38727 RepID=A0A8T0WMY3_PANVG|nr:protein RALF-like 22 [Panicum virgatum]KAG2647447.1 hypothetical protein PVAP13_2KG592900 [Panicum virgatum]
MARHAPLLFTIAAVLAVAAASASSYVRAADKELMIIGGDDDVFGLGGVIGGRRRLEDLNGTSPDANATSADGNSTSTGYISYLALSRDSVPCSQRGASYYNCRPGAEANPYSRGCSAITQCRG